MISFEALILMRKWKFESSLNFRAREPEILRATVPGTGTVRTVGLPAYGVRNNAL